MKIVKVIAAVIGIVVLLALGTGMYINFALPDVGDAPDITVSKDSGSVERSKYLATHVAVCIDCHSRRDWRSAILLRKAPRALGCA